MGSTKRNIEVIFSLKLNAFIELDDNRKFDSKKHDDLVFFDGTSVNSWFNNNKDKILKNPTVLMQYEIVKGPRRLSFKDKIKEFEQETSIDKYNKYSKKTKFSDGVSMGPWFDYSGYRVIIASEKIRIEYLRYLNGVIKDETLKSLYKDSDYKKAGIPLSKRQ